VDGPRFDAIARAAAAPGSRRRLLALASAALGIAGRDRADAAAICRTPGQLCRENANCCSRACATDATGRRVCRCHTQADCPPPTNKCLAATCAGGLCGTTPSVVCAALDQCHAAGICVPATGTCTNPAKPNGTGCNDANACTQTDTCEGGVCTGSNPVVCTALDQCHVAGTCDPSTGACSNPTATDGTACTPAGGGSGTCQGGSCVAPTTTTTTTTTTTAAPVCSPACASGQGCCSGTCTALNTTSNCGACGNVCSACLGAADPICYQDIDGNSHFCGGTGSCAICSNDGDCQLLLRGSHCIRRAACRQGTACHLPCPPPT
jgi:hypothetical protein